MSNIEVISSVPVPAALWLFGSTLFVWSGLRKTRT
ncbi:PEP-CTERM sorting domain-containing protein [Methylomonas sp. HYX-M1]